MAACPECGADPVRVGQVRQSPRSNEWRDGFECDGCGVIRVLTEEDPEELHEVAKAMGKILVRRIIQLAIAEQFLLVAGGVIGWFAGSWVAGLVVGAFAGMALFLPTIIFAFRRRMLN